MNQPTKKLPELLVGCDYDRFEDLIHQYVEEILVCLLAITFPSAILKRLNTDELKRGARPEEAMALLTSALLTTNHLQRMSLEFRMFLYPGSVRPEGMNLSKESFALNEEVNRERWKPYDESAWDSFFEKMSNVLLPAFAHIDRLNSQLDALIPLIDPGDGSETQQAKSVKVLKESRPRSYEAEKRFRLLLDREAVKKVEWA